MVLYLQQVVLSLLPLPVTTSHLVSYVSIVHIIYIHSFNHVSIFFNHTFISVIHFVSRTSIHSYFSLSYSSIQQS